MFANNFTLNPIWCKHQTFHQNFPLLQLSVRITGKNDELVINSPEQVSIIIKINMVFNYSPKYCCYNFLFIKTCILGSKTDFNSIPGMRINMN